jgi:hypothetical protein
VAGVGPGDIHSLAEEYLTACVDALDTIPTYDPTLVGAPERSFVTMALPALDCCPQLTVHIGPVSEGASEPAVPSASSFRINRVAFVATAVRCVPIGPTPLPEEQEEAARQINADKWALWNHIWNLVRSDQLFTRCSDVLWPDMAPLNAQGGCAGTVLTVVAAVDGYEEAISS